MNYNWNWGIFFEMSPEGTGTYLEVLLFGLETTIVTAFFAWLVALGVGSIIGIMRTLPMKWAQRIGNAYVEIFRNVPLAGAAFSLVFRPAGTFAGRSRAMAEKCAQRAILHGCRRHWLLHVVPRLRAGTGRHQFATARTANGR